jgi:hypothetical protein
VVELVSLVHERDRLAVGRPGGSAQPVVDVGRERAPVMAVGGDDVEAGEIPTRSYLRTIERDSLAVG